MTNSMSTLKREVKSKKEDNNYVDLAVFEIENLKLRTVIGFNDWERKNKQDVIVNIKARFKVGKAARTDRVEDTVNYKTIVKQVINLVEKSDYNLLETIAQMILDIVMKNHLIVWAKVKVDKPFALRFTDSVSIKLKTTR
ncbi:MAG: dihydroneopterin aldolase [Hormoscilla sp. SP5CHS1]|nr:dihydroneopterin aldolase [Hormoscilla sp. SP5CHS1]